MVMVACSAVLFWAVRRISDNLSPARDVARRVEYDMDLDRQAAIETLIRASGTEIDVALPALIKLQAMPGPTNEAGCLSPWQTWSRSGSRLWLPRPYVLAPSWRAGRRSPCSLHFATP